MIRHQWLTPKNRGNFGLADGKPHDAGVKITRIGRDVEAELLAHLEHDGVFAQHLSLDQS